MEAPMRRDFEALDRSEVAEAVVEAREWERIWAEAEAGREKYRGVKKVPSGKYAADIHIRDPNTGKQLWLGTYNAALLAAVAYDIAARSLQGHRAKPNFAYPPPPGFVATVAAAPRRRGHSCHAPPAPPSPAPAPAPIIGHFSFQARAANEPAAYHFQHVPRPARARIVPVPAKAPETEITVVRPIPPQSFSYQAAAATSHRAYDPVIPFDPPMHMLAPASPAKTCCSSTEDPKLRDSASSSTSRRRLMLKKTKVIADPTTTTPTPSTDADSEFTGDNFTEESVPWFYKLPLSPRTPIDLNDAL